MERKSAVPARLTYIYLALPTAIFLIGWLRWYIAVPAVAALAAGLFSALRHAPRLFVPTWDKKSLRTLIFALATIVFMVIVSGIGKYMFQNQDLYWRNAIFDALLSHSWPVKDVSANGNPVALVYYISFWLPAALMGKAFGAGVGYFFLSLWTALGLILFYFLLCAKLRRFSLWPLALFFAFSGMDFLILILKGSGATAFSATAHLEWNLAGFQYSSFTTQLFWVFNQALPIWCATMLLIQLESNRHVAFLLSLTLLSSTLPFIGTVPIALTLVFTRSYDAADKKARFKAFIKDTLTWENLISGFFVALISAAYLFSNSRADGGGDGFGLIFSRYDSIVKLAASYAAFVVLEFGLYYALIWKRRRRDRLFLTSFITLILVPFFILGIGIDFCMRVSIPSLLMLFLFVAETLPEWFREKKWRLLVPLLICLLLGAKTPFNEVARSFVKTAEGITDAGTFDLMHKEGEENFVANGDTPFFEVIAK